MTKKKSPFIPYLICGIELEMEYDLNKLGYIRRYNYHDSTQDRYEAFSDSFIAENDGSLQATKFYDSNGDRICSGCDGYGYFNEDGNPDSNGCEECDVCCGHGEIYEDESNPNDFCVELISNPFKLSDYKKVLTDFQDEVYERVRHNTTGNKTKTKEELIKKYPLKDLINFNKSCGSHIHLSCFNEAFTRNKTTINGVTFKGKRTLLKNVVYYKFIKKFRKQLEKNVQTELPHLYEKWLQQTNRNYSKKICNTKSLKQAKTCSRHSEWNMTDIKNGMEYRAFNLYGVETWKDFFKIWDIAMNTLQETFMTELNKKLPFMQSTTKSFEITAQPLKKIERKIEKEIYNISGRQKRNINVEVKPKCVISI